MPQPIRLTLLAALALAGTAQAQSLLELYDAARAYDATYLSVRANTESAEFKALQAEAANRPSAQATLSSTLARNEPPVATSRVTTGNLAAGVLGKYALYNKGNALSIDQAKRAYEGARIALESAEQALMVRVAQAYFDVLTAQDTLATSKANSKAIGEQLASAKRNFEVGTATITDAREAQSRYDLALAQEIAADNDLRVKQVVLDQTVGRSGVTPKPVALPVVLPALPSRVLDTWVATADEQSLDVRGKRLTLEVARLETEKARAAEGPTVDVTAQVNVSEGRNNKPAAIAPSFGEGSTRSGQLAVTLTYPLTTGGATQNRIKETLKLEEQARNDLDIARRKATQDTKSAFLGYESGLAQVKAYEAAEVSSRLSLEATQLGYKVGVRVNLDVLNAQTQLYNTLQSLSKARYDVLVTGLKLRQATGQLRMEDISAIDGLLAK